MHSHLIHWQQVFDELRRAASCIFFEQDENKLRFSFGVEILIFKKKFFFFDNNNKKL